MPIMPKLHFRRRLWVVMLPLLLVILVRVTRSSIGQAAIGGEVHGSVYALVRGQELATGKADGDPNIFVPDVSVYLQNTTTSATTPAVTTDLDGMFNIPAQPQAQYRLCWKKSGFIAACSSQVFALRSGTKNLQPMGITAHPGIVFGRVTLKDGLACRFVEPFVGVNTFTQVNAQTATAKATVRANSYGEYVLSGLPAGAVKLTAACEAAQVSNTISLSTSAVQANLTLPNATPNVDLAYASVGSHMIRSAASGATVQVTLNAAAGGSFPLHYRWAVDPPVSGFVSHDSPTIDWTVPGPGLATIYGLAYDGHGGNALRRVKLSTTPNHIVFSGSVTGNDAPVLTGAGVTINGKQAVTNTAGQFLLVLPNEEPRYVITIEKTGYQMLSRILYAPVTGASFKLFRAQDSVVDPRFPINVVERPKTGREQLGVQILIDANSLAAGADGKGPLATAPLHIRPASYDLHNPEDQLPGDYAGMDSAGHQYRLSTFGSADVSIQDAMGKPYNVAPGKTATVRMPIDAAMLATAPPTIPLWHYDKAQGLWLRDGTATRNGNVYEGKVRHFSAVNMDLAFGDGACTVITVDTAIMPVPFKLLMTPLTGGFTVDANHQNQVISDAVNVVVREPPNTQVQFDVVDSAGNVVLAARQTITTGDSSPSGTMWDPPPDAPYSDCTSQVHYDVHTVQGIFPVPPQGFLSFRTPPQYLDPAQAPALASAYYAAIDPGHTKTTPGDNADFAHWKTANGFDRPGEVHAKYRNELDLGFGRDMHMQRGGVNGSCTNCIAYYVTNYPSIEDAVSGTNRAATVAMEFSPLNGVSGTPYTKFYVFDANGAIANSVALDDFGPKFVPTLCIVCHNGNTASMGAHGELGNARFIPFDVQSFGYHPTNPAFQRPAQEGAFKELNRGVMDHTNVSGPIRLLITHWYGSEGDTTLPSPNFDDNAVPSQWTNPTDESGLYNAVVKTSCRSCHTTRDPGDTGQDISWQSYDSLDNESAFARILTCAPAGLFHHVMPQAERTFARFWLSTQPNGPATIASSTLSGFQPPNNTCQ